MSGGIVEPPRTFLAVVRRLGPGLIVAGSIVGSGELIATTKVGAESGFVLLWLILIGCAGLMAHFCLTKALSLAPASVVLPIDFVRLPVIAVVGMLFYDEPLQFSVLNGAVIIFTSNYLNIIAETRIRTQ